ncbi:hypothetical protein ASPBRDRAFT_49654 [Aspergillus brasiliensis CBS 101740]|uniref:BZIP domain-containing protein n=1 Tax=Aspergillus brasiliensis (strain CBS 101740 / IMI 381727 / IBT 21946) TaxID=767769 RepID=A0A1L9U1M1_ASPBC|nr:hypothetical protein ASPBRDRAFT_49654 [Aspergillus brasiliensis CBS 101740]
MRLSANLNLHATFSGPPATAESFWPGLLPVFTDNTVSRDCVSLLLIAEDNPWLLSSWSPMSLAVGPAARTHSTASSEASFIAPCQIMHRPSDHQWDFSTARTFAFDASAQTSPPLLHTTTPPDSITNNSSGENGGSQWLSSNSSHSRNNQSSTYDAQESLHKIPPLEYEEDERERHKRERALERNRVAADKCRKKKKEHAKYLESRCETVLRENTYLQTEVNSLRSEVLILKNELLRHSRCRDEGIKRHLMRMVKQSSGNARTVSGNLEGKAEPLEQTGSIKQDQGMTSEFDDLVALPASGDGSLAEEQEDTERLPD